MWFSEWPRPTRPVVIFIAVAALLAGFAAAVGPATADERKPVIKLRWASETALKVTGSGFEPTSTVAVDGTTEGGSGSGAVRADNAGQFVATLSLAGTTTSSAVNVTASSGTSEARASIDALGVSSPAPGPATTAPPRTVTSAMPQALRPKGPSGNFRLIFNDEFSGDVLDKSKWNTCLHWGCEGANKEVESQRYTPDNVTLDGGAAIFTLKKNGSSSSKPYTSGMLAAHPRHSFTYGYMEMRAKLPNCQGCWPAFWAAPGSLEWPPEIDVMERLTNENDAISTNYHWNEGGPKSAGAPSYNDSYDMSKGYHTFGAEWSAKAIVWYVDGKEIARYTDAEHIAKVPMYVMANLAIDRGRGSPPPGAQMHIDYIRVFKRP